MDRTGHDERTGDGAIGRLLTAAVVAAIVSVFVILVFGPEKSGTTASTSKLQQIINRGSIEAGYIAYPPDSYVDDGRVYGIFPDALQMAAEKLGLEINWSKETDWGAMITDLNEDKFDMLGTAVLRTPSRSKAASFTEPLFYEATGVYVRAGDGRFDGDVGLLNDPEVTIATIDGEISAILKEELFPEAQAPGLTNVSQPSQLLLEVAEQKADATVLSTRLAARWMEANPGRIKNIAADAPVRITPVCMMVPLDQPELLSALNAAILEIRSGGYVEDLVRQYDRENFGGYYFVAPPYTVPSDSR